MKIRQALGSAERLVGNSWETTGLLLTSDIDGIFYFGVLQDTHWNFVCPRFIDLQQCG
jgi:hypothetical protein